MHNAIIAGPHVPVVHGFDIDAYPPAKPSINLISTYAQAPESSMDPVLMRTLKPESSMDPVLMRTLTPESSMDPVSVQIEQPSVQIPVPWTIPFAFFAEIPSMDPILMHAIIQGLHIGAEEAKIRADIGSMDENSSCLISM